MKIRYKVVKNCFCEHYLHEALNYPREGLTSKKLSVGDEVTLLEKWSNFYGTYLRVTKDGDNNYYDILPENLELIENE